MNDNIKKLQNASLLMADLVRCEQWREVARVAGEMQRLAEAIQQEQYASEARQTLHPIIAQALGDTWRSFAYTMAGLPEPESKE